MAKKPPTIVESIDRTLTVVNFTANGTELGSVQDRVSKDICRLLMEARVLGETLEGLLGPGDEKQ